MSKFKFLKIYRSKKIRYLSLNTYSDLFVVFLHGFMSDLEGDKPKTFQSYCKKKQFRIPRFRVFWARKIFMKIY